ncbi:MAG: hypothetical protein K0S38_497 [Candidatus Paceibacter sp.]|jgi:hypothetical protein|nr:hypothetical protein [Candidatus Paceibacter sp.]
MNLIDKCRFLINACDEGKLGTTVMPEDSSPTFTDKQKEKRIAYFTLPMALNYQRDSYKLWEAALKTWNDKETRVVFDVKKAAALDTDVLRKYLGRYRLALQPNKHTHSWQSISKVVTEEWGSFEKMLSALDYDFLKLKQTIQGTHKKRFPYLSGPKIFNYWSSILKRYAQVELKNIEHIELAVDTHILKCSIALEVITSEEALKLERLAIADKWRKALNGSGIAPSEMHFILWFWSRNGFLYTFDK